MRYCNQCRKLSLGEALFCNFCGRSYETKFCPSRHPNPRSAQVCSQCGSRDLSTPQPHVAFWVAPLLYTLSLLPGVFLLLISILFLTGLVHEIVTNPQMLTPFFGMGLALALLWYVYMQVPHFIRDIFRKALGRKGKSKGDGHGH